MSSFPQMPTVSPRSRPIRLVETCVPVRWDTTRTKRYFRQGDRFQELLAVGSNGSRVGRLPCERASDGGPNEIASLVRSPSHPDKQRERIKLMASSLIRARLGGVLGCRLGVIRHPSTLNITFRAAQGCST